MNTKITFTMNIYVKLKIIMRNEVMRSASSPSLVVRRTRLSTYGDRAFPVAALRVWNSLPHHVTSAQSLPVFCRWRLISSVAVFVDYVVVPAKWHSSLRTL